MKKWKILSCLLCLFLMTFVLKINTVNARYVEESTLINADAYNSKNPFKGDLWGQCTWYVWGRMYEKTGVELPSGLGHAGTWYQNAPAQYKSTTLQENSILVIESSTYSSVGHVVFIEKIVGDIAYISEGNYDGTGTLTGYHEDTKNINNLKVGSYYYGGTNGKVVGYIVSGKSLPSYIPSGSIQDIGTDFLAYITQIDNTNLAVGATEFKQAGNVTLQTKGSNATKWKFLRQSDGSYFIQNQANPDYYLDVSGNGNESGNNVYVWTNHSGDKMRWYIYNYNGAYRLVPKSANDYRLALDIKDGNIKNGQNMQIWEAENATNKAQTFKIEKILLRPSGDYIDIGTDFVASIVAKSNTNLAVGATEYRQAGNVTLQTKGSNATKWKFLRQSDGSYFIQNQANTDYYLDVSDNGNKNKDNVYVWTRHEGNKMRWYIYNYNGAYRLVPKSGFEDRLALDITDNTVTNGTNIEIYEALRNDNAAQTFYIEKEVESVSIKMSSTKIRVGEEEKVTAVITPQSSNISCKWRVSSGSIATIFNGHEQTAYVKGLKTGTTVLSLTCGSKSVSKQITIVDTSVVYQTQVQKQGWLNKVSNGVTSGTTGSGLRMETLKVTLENQEYSGNVEYKTHVQKSGWETTWKKNGEMSGSVGKGLRLEALQLRLTGEMANHYDIYYRIHSQRFGWLDWAKNGEKAGTAGFGFRVEAIQIKLVKKGSSAPGSTARPYVSFDNTSVSYQTQVQKQGWLKPVTNGATSGTTGSYLRMEGLKIKLQNQGFTGNVEYRTHIQKTGWESTWKKNGELSGTQGLALRLEALQLRLTGNMAKEYDIYYRVHAQRFGWLGWAKNGESAGTAGYGYRLEAIQIVLVRKGMTPPGSTANHYYSK